MPSNKTTIEIRPLTAQDADAFWRLRLEALERHPEAFASSVEEHRATSPEKVSARLQASNDDNYIVGAFAGRDLAGTAGFARDMRPKTRHKGMIWGVYVTGEWRSQGVGRSLISEILRRAHTLQGLEQVRLTVGDTQTAAVQLYTSLGFQVYGFEQGALKVGDTYVDESYMVYHLRS